MPTMSAPPFRQKRKWFISYVIKSAPGYTPATSHHSIIVDIHPALWQAQKDEQCEFNEHRIVVTFYDELPADVSAQL